MNILAVVVSIPISIVLRQYWIEYSIVLENIDSKKISIDIVMTLFQYYFQYLVF